MKTIKKLLPLILIFAIVLGSFGVSANTAITGFPDVPTTHWAHDNIVLMANQGLIRGFQDGTFGPELSITHLHSLILLARVLGLDESVNEQIAERHLELYADILEPFNTNGFELEVAFLIYNDVLSVDELEMYISNEPLPRYRAAMLLTKLMGGEMEVLGAPMVMSSFRDAGLFPPGTRGFAEFVLTNGLMQGTGVDEETNAPFFAPLGLVTRAQMATMLVNLLPTPLGREHVTGTISSFVTSPNVGITQFRLDVGNNSENYLIEFLDNTVMYVDGVRSRSAQGIRNGDLVRITYINENPRIVDIYTTAPDWWVGAGTGNNNNQNNNNNNNNNANATQIYGILFNVEHSGGLIQVVLQNIDVPGVHGRTRYTIAPNAVITIDGVPTILQDVRNNDLAYLTIVNDTVTELHTHTRSRTVNGTLNRIVNLNSLEIRLANDDLVIYPFMQNRTIAVIRNGFTSNLGDLMIGDTIELELEHNRIIRVTARSIHFQQAGTIEEIRIAANPTISIRVNNELYTFYIADNVEITLDGTAGGTLADLNIGSQIRFSAESRTITLIESTTVPSLDFVEGVIEVVDEQFRIIRVAITNPVTQAVTSQYILVLNNANITQVGVPALRQISHLRVGQRIFAHGTNVTGTFRADTITIVSD